MGYRKNLLKLSGEFLGRPLFHIYSRSLAIGKFSDGFKYSVVNPLFQSREKSLLYNFNFHFSISIYFTVHGSRIGSKTFGYRTSHDTLSNRYIHDIKYKVTQK
jgi:hypothetical protein